MNDNENPVFCGSGYYWVKYLEYDTYEIVDVIEEDWFHSTYSVYRIGDEEKYAIDEFEFIEYIDDKGRRCVLAKEGAIPESDGWVLRGKAEMRDFSREEILEIIDTVDKHEKKYGKLGETKGEVK